MRHADYKASANLFLCVTVKPQSDKLTLLFITRHSLSNSHNVYFMLIYILLGMFGGSFLWVSDIANLCCRSINKLNYSIYYMHTSETCNLYVTQRTRMSLQISLWYMISFLIATTISQTISICIQRGLDILKTYVTFVNSFLTFVWHTMDLLLNAKRMKRKHDM